MQIVRAALPNLLAVLMQFVASYIIISNASSLLYGQWSYSFSLFTMLCSVGVLGSGGLVLREFTRSGDSERHIAVIKHSLSILLVVSIIVLPIIYIHFSQLEKSAFSEPLWLAVHMTIPVFLFGLSVVASQYFLSQKKQLISANLQFIPKPLSLMFASISTFVTLSLTNMWFVFSLGSLLLLIGHTKQLRDLLSYLKGRLSISKTYLSQGILIVLIYSYIQINIYVDSYFLLDLAETEDVGFYRLAFMFASLGLFIPTSITRQISPYIGDFLEGKITLKDFQNNLQKHNRLAVLAVLGILLVSWLAGKYVFASFFGEEYLVSFIPLIIILIGYLIKFMFGPCEMVLNLSFNDRILALIIFLGIIINAVLDWLLIEEYGIVGCALGTTLIISAMMITCSIIAYRKTKINTTIFYLRKIK